VGSNRFDVVRIAGRRICAASKIKRKRGRKRRTEASNCNHSAEANPHRRARALGDRLSASSGLRCGFEHAKPRGELAGVTHKAFDWKAGTNTIPAAYSDDDCDRFGGTLARAALPKALPCNRQSSVVPAHP
jgi:hypothetical protein